MSTLTKAKKPARPVRKPSTRRAAALPPIPKTSPLYGHDSFVGCVNLNLPQTKEARRAHIRARIYADNHS
ncbi:MAG: hypothetical protein WC205_12105 [Opitutaceae bacterium]